MSDEKKEDYEGIEVFREKDPDELEGPDEYGEGEFPPVEDSPTALAAYDGEDDGEEVIEPGEVEELIEEGTEDYGEGAFPDPDWTDGVPAEDPEYPEDF